jgi:uncharacterized membrane protein YidH (DUF202 family)
VSSDARGRGGGEGVRTRDHLANTRTLLAFLRIGLVLGGIGLVMDKLEQLQGAHGHSLGLPVAAAGWLVTAAAGGRFLLQRRAIEGGTRRSHVTWDLVLVAVVAAAGVVVLLWLASN